MTGAGLTGAIVTTGIAMAGTVAWLVTTNLPATDGDRDRVPLDATAQVDGPRRQVGADPITIEQGRVYYVQICLPCHGVLGDGRGEWAYRVTPLPANLTHRRTQARSDAELFDIISQPQPGTPMLGWARQLSQSQRQQVVAYVRHLGTGGESGVRH